MSAASPRLIFNQRVPPTAVGSPAVSSEVTQAQPFHPLAIVDLDQAMNKMASLMQGTSRVPTQGAVELALEWLSLTFDRGYKLGGWRRPHISSTEDGEVVFEWWQGKRNLTLYLATMALSTLRCGVPIWTTRCFRARLPIGHFRTLGSDCIHDVAWFPR